MFNKCLDMSKKIIHNFFTKRKFKISISLLRQAGLISKKSLT